MKGWCLVVFGGGEVGDGRDEDDVFFGGGWSNESRQTEKIRWLAKHHKRPRLRLAGACFVFCLLSLMVCLFVFLERRS